MITIFTISGKNSCLARDHNQWQWCGRYVPGISSDERLARNSVEQTRANRHSSCQHITTHHNSTLYHTTNVTCHHRGMKQKLHAGYRVPSLQRTSHVVMCFHRRVWYHTLSVLYARI